MVSPISGSYRVWRGVGLGGEEEGKREGNGGIAFTCNAPAVSSEWVGREGVGQEGERAAGTAPGTAGRRFDRGVVLKSPELPAAEGGGK